MNLFHLFYNLIGTTAGALAIPTYWFSQRKNTETLDRLHQRLGWYPPSISNPEFSAAAPASAGVLT